MRKRGREIERGGSGLRKRERERRKGEGNEGQDRREKERARGRREREGWRRERGVNKRVEYPQYPEKTNGAATELGNRVRNHRNGTRPSWGAVQTDDAHNFELG